MKATLIFIFMLTVTAANAQWKIQDSHSTADLNGVYAIDQNVAWASGSNGAILRTEDGGATWQACAAPSEAGNLNFINIQAFDNKTAVVMSTGKGDRSRVYKTTDGCQTWKKVLDNPNAGSSFGSMLRATAFEMYLVGDPVNGRFPMFVSQDAGDSWSASEDPGLAAPKAGQATVGSAALTSVISLIAFGTGGQGASVYVYSPSCRGDRCIVGWAGKAVPFGQGSATSGVFSVAGRNLMVATRAIVTGIGTEPATVLVAVGGDSQNGTASAAFSTDDGANWKAAETPPGGYRSAVEFDGDGERFIAVGPNGTDETVDDGLIWQAIKPGAGDSPDADKNWTALSLPFVVGPHGRIGKLTAAQASNIFRER